MLRRLFVVLVAAVVGGSAWAAPAYAITGGSPATGASVGFVAKLEVGGRSCTGALVDPQWVITARSCFQESGKWLATGAPSVPTTARVGVDVPTGSPGRVLPVVRVVPHSGRDVLLAKLSLRVPDVPSVPLAQSVPVAGEDLAAGGFGRTGTEWVPGRLQAAAVTVGPVGAGSFSWTGTGGTGVSACLGDAGGPVVRNGDRPVLVGLIVGSGQGGCLAATDGAQGGEAVRLDDLAGWVDEFTTGYTDEFTDFYDNNSAGIGGFDFANPVDRAVAFDWEHSGRLDHLVMYRPGDGIAIVAKSNADGTYSEVFRSATGIGGATGFDLKGAGDRIVAFDWEGSGKADHLVLYRPGSRKLYVFRHGAGATFTKVFETHAGLPDFDLANAADQVVAFDHEHSGRLDHLVLYRPGAKKVTIVKRDTGSSFRSVFTSSTGLAGFDLAAAQDRVIAFDDDQTGKLDDLVLYRPGSGRIIIARHGADNTFSAVLNGTVETLTEARDQLVAFDYARTGKQDHLVFYRPGTGRVHIGRHNGVGGLRLIWSSQTGIGGYDLRGTADRLVAFDNDRSGGSNYLLAHRPGGRTAWVVGRQPEPVPPRIVIVPPPADTSGFLVEDYRYPGADQILAEHGLRLISGDGHIVFVTSRKFEDGQCEPGQIQVEQLTADRGGVFYCFRTIGTQGHLRLEVPGTFNIRGGSTPLVATAHLPGEPDQTYLVPPNQAVPIEPGDGSEFPPAILVELRLT